MSLLEYARNTVGMRMGGLHNGRRIGWTTDAEKAESMRVAGATSLTVRDPFDGVRIIGWEVSFAADSARLVPEDYAADAL